jgi:hypothetical protein
MLNWQLFIIRAFTIGQDGAENRSLHPPLHLSLKSVLSVSQQQLRRNFLLDSTAFAGVQLSMASRAVSIPRARGGRGVSIVPSVMAAGLSTLWYVAVVVPDAQINFHREWNRKDVKFSDPGRLISLIMSLGYLASLPTAVVLHMVGRPKAGKFAAVAVGLNAPTVLIAGVVVSEIAIKLAGNIRGIFRAVAGFVHRK